MNFKDRKEEYMGGLGGRKWKGEMKEKRNKSSSIIKISNQGLNFWSQLQPEQEA